MRNLLFRKLSILTTAFLLFACLPGWAQDLPDSKDHPVVSRFQDARIVGYSQKDFDALEIMTGPAERDESGKFVPTSSRQLEGRVTRFLYLGPRNSSPLQVFRSYQNSLKSSGFETLFAASKEELGPGFKDLIYSGDKLLNNSQLAQYSFWKVADHYHLTARKQGGESGKDIYVSLSVARHTGGILSEISDNTVTLLEIVEVEPMAGGKVQVTAENLQKSIEETGKAVIYEIYFDTDKTYPREDSAAALQQIIKLLNANPDLKVYLVGHTDDVGELDYNLELSKKRAQSVVTFLEQSAGLKPGRLIPRGVGPLAPVATNRTSEGKAKNRRVELVEITP